MTTADPHPDDVRQALRDAILAALHTTNPLHYDDAAEEVADALLAGSIGDKVEHLMRAHRDDR
jgi:hypothetical protein